MSHCHTLILKNQTSKINGVTLNISSPTLIGLIQNLGYENEVYKFKFVLYRAS